MKHHNLNPINNCLIHFQMDIFDAAQRYKTDNKTVILLAGKEYGSGSSRDWAAKGPWILVSSHGY